MVALALAVFAAADRKVSCLVDNCSMCHHSRVYGCVECNPGYIVTHTDYGNECIPSKSRVNERARRAMQYTSHSGTCAIYDDAHDKCVLCKRKYIQDKHGSCTRYRKPCRDPLCAKCDVHTNECLECKRAYFLYHESGTCSSTPISVDCNDKRACVTCAANDEGTCFRCRSGYFLIPDKGECIAKCAENRCAWCAADESKCLKCHSDYSLNYDHGFCFPRCAHPWCKTCAGYDSHHCGECHSDYVLNPDNGKCYPITPTSTTCNQPSCWTCAGNNLDECLECAPEHFLGVDHWCTPTRSSTWLDFETIMIIIVGIALEIAACLPVFFIARKIKCLKKGNTKKKLDTVEISGQAVEPEHARPTPHANTLSHDQMFVASASQPGCVFHADALSHDAGHLLYPVPVLPDVPPLNS